MKEKIGIAYIPVLHRGYIDFLERVKTEGVEVLYLIGDDILNAEEELDYINRKDRLRALPLSAVKDFLMPYTRLQVKKLSSGEINDLQSQDVQIFTPKEDIGSFVVKKFFSDKKTSFVDVFLRWNKDNVGEDKEPVTADTIEVSDFQRALFSNILKEAETSSDWWRRVGAALVKDGSVIVILHNEHMPEEQGPNIFGDTRALFKKGIHINYVTSAHAEGAVIAYAAKHGISTEGAELYVTDFPCPYCARIIAKSGIKKVYFLKGYAVLDGDNFLKEEGVEVVKVKM